MLTTNNHKSSNSKSDLTKTEEIIVKAFARLFKTDETQVLKKVDLTLFSKCSFELARSFECLSQMEEEKLINALISLEYLLEFDKTVKDVMDGEKS